MFIFPLINGKTMPYEAKHRIKTSIRTFDIIEQLSQDGKVGVSTLAAELGMNKGIVHNHLSTLRELRYIQKIGEQYQLSPKLLNIGFQAREQSELYQYAGELITEFGDRFDLGTVLFQQSETESAWLMHIRFRHSMNSRLAQQSRFMIRSSAW